MTVNLSTTKIQYSGNGILTTFTYTFRILEDDDLYVSVVDAAGTETILSLDVDYTVTGAGDDSGGTVVLSSGTLCPTGSTLTIMRNMDLLQETDYVDGDAFSAESFEDAADKSIMIVQQLDERLDRSVCAPKFSNDSLEIDAAEWMARENKTIGFDVDGDIALLPSTITAAVAESGSYILISDAPYSNDLTVLVSELGGTHINVLIDSTVSTTGVTVVPVNLKLIVTVRGRINNSHAVTINGPFEAGIHTIFTGSAAVTFGPGTVSSLKPEWWGAKADGVWTSGTDYYGNPTGITCTGTDSTDAINAATTCATSGQSVVEFQSGTYLATALNFDSGINWVGKGTKKTSASAGAPSGTVIKQINGTNADFITTPSANSWIESASIRGIRIIGDPTGAATAGSGLVLNKRSGENFILDDVRVEYFPGHGVKFTRGVQPASVEDVRLYWNGYADASKGSGLYITRYSDAGPPAVSDELQGGEFSNISGDSNQVALVYIEGGLPLSTAGGTINFYNVKAETGETGTQQNVFVFDACAGLGVGVFGASNINTGSPEITTNSIFKITNSAAPTVKSVPALTWANVGAESDTSYILDDDNGSDASIQLANTGGTRYSSGTYNTSGIAYNGLTFGNPPPTSTDTAFLDYYKESTFTPTLTFASGNDHTYTTQVGKATRIGDTVHFSLQIVINSKGTSAGNFTVDGLPYTSTTQVCAVSARLNNMATGIGDTTTVQGLIGSSSTSITLSKLNATATQLAVGDLGTATSIVISGTYFTTAN